MSGEDPSIDLAPDALPGGGADGSDTPAPDHPGARLARRAGPLVLGRPRGVHPVLVVFAGLAGLSYTWGSSTEGLEPYYAAAVRSMSTSWHNFFFGAFDPAGTITVDKLPGALWLQALSVRWFGLHVWAIVLPQVVEGVLAVFVIYRAVSRLASPVAGLVAAGILAAAPATVALDRGNVSDSLLALLLVLAASATTKAIVTGRWRSLLLAGVWVGLAFQAKMVQAWVVLPPPWPSPASSPVRRACGAGCRNSAGRAFCARPCRSAGWSPSASCPNTTGPTWTGAARLDLRAGLRVQRHRPLHPQRAPGLGRHPDGAGGAACSARPS